MGSVASSDAVLNALPKTFETEQGGQIGFKALNAKLIPAIELATELGEAAEVAVLHNFLKNVKGGQTKFDADVDNHNMPCLLENNIYSVDGFDMKLYKNLDPLLPDHVA